MRLIGLVLTTAMVVGLTAGGRPSRLVGVEIRWRWTGLVGLLMQLAPLPGSLERLSVPILLLSLAMLVVFVVANLRVRGFELVLIGLLLNVVVIGLNAGMPVSRPALVASGQLDSLTYLEQHGGAKHHLADDEDLAMWLGDVIAVPPPVGLVVSVGDLIAYAGIGVFIVVGMTDRATRRRASPSAQVTAEGTGMAS